MNNCEGCGRDCRGDYCASCVSHGFSHRRERKGRPQRTPSSERLLEDCDEQPQVEDSTGRYHGQSIRDDI